MKKHLFIIIALCSSIFGLQNISAKVATTKDIELHAKEANQPTRRSVLPVRAWLENTKVCVSFLDPSLEVSIKIMNSDGIVVEEIVAKSHQYVQISMYGYSGSYTIEVSYGDTIFCGLFKCGE
ncbi:DUF3244 domain-containing protein [Parabacteroides sp. AM08-6]|uniref:DUF3244 domain-containing protein n=1 Tax=Parabacteroides sp. AM08-6 TaxID=2292053 RepID=UPI000F005168|nr:DUF3244 domain-containing protein [Parabacteroides sp. AM08-6]RHJ85307.1 DUF3244 domain-containing protein [Parabacteroides sp. AM08-6]